jgi:hypothetical protein
MPKTTYTPEGLDRLCLSLLDAEQQMGKPLVGFVAPTTCVRLMGADTPLTDGAVSVEGIWRGMRPTSAHMRLAHKEVEAWVEGVEATFLPILNGIAAHLNRLSPGMRSLVRAGEIGACVAAYVLVGDHGTPTFRYALGANSWKVRVRALTDGVRAQSFAGVVHCARLSGKGLARRSDWLISLVEAPTPQHWTVRAASGEDALLWAAGTQDHNLLHKMSKCTVARVAPEAPRLAQQHVWEHHHALFAKG